MAAPSAVRVYPLRAGAAASSPPGPGPPGPRGRRRVRTAEEIRSRKRQWQRERMQRSVYLGGSWEKWRELRGRTGARSDEETAEILLHSFSTGEHVISSGKACQPGEFQHLHTTCDALRHLVSWSHDHAKQCSLLPDVRSVVTGQSEAGFAVIIWACDAGHTYSWDSASGSVPDQDSGDDGNGHPPGSREPTPAAKPTGQRAGRGRKAGRPGGKAKPDSGLEAKKEESRDVGEAAMDCEPSAGAARSKSPPRTARANRTEAKDLETLAGYIVLQEPEETPAAGRGDGRRPPAEQVKEEGGGAAEAPLCDAVAQGEQEVGAALVRTPVSSEGERSAVEEPAPEAEGGTADFLHLECESDNEAQEEEEEDEEESLGSDVQLLEEEDLNSSEMDSEEDELEVETEEDFEFYDDPKDENYIPSSDSGSDTEKPRRSKRNRRKSQEKPVRERTGNEARPSSAVVYRKYRPSGRKRNKPKPPKLRETRPPREKKKKRKKLVKEYVRCPFPDCGKIISNPQYLKRHIKYQHEATKTYACSILGCGRIFRFKTQVEEHERLHSDQRDYICEFCGRLFKRDKNLMVHRRIHTGEKPLQCEICGFTCRQKASLNWHMKKHDAESTYQFSCDICGKKFEKRDNVSAHKSKSHPETLLPTLVPLGGTDP
ncbi:zinc finger protein 692-like isoform X2 [Latimeria chalumnae]|uniref:zinc finger protein 692-like isoform X2 n=1 Tax=Latimeria chalumnae TaxID=7897 RepID=UPI00313D3215